MTPETTYTLTQLTPELMKSVGIWVICMAVVAVVARDFLRAWAARLTSFFGGF